MFCAPLVVDAWAIPPQEFKPVGHVTFHWMPLPLESPVTLAETASA
jgi:hypothetical protein